MLFKKHRSPRIPSAFRRPPILARVWPTLVSRFHAFKSRRRRHTAQQPFHGRLRSALLDNNRTLRSRLRRIGAELSRSRLKLPPWAIAALLLAAGFGAGILVMKQRQHAREVVMSIGGETVSAPEFHHRLEVANGNAVLHKLAIEKLTLQYARRLGAIPTDAAITARLRPIMGSPDYGRYLRDTHQTQEDLLCSTRITLAEENLFGATITVTDEDVQNYYHRQSDPNYRAAKYYSPASVRVQVISTATRSESDRALRKLKAGTPFDAVAKQCSHDGSAALGGNGPAIRKGRSALRNFIGFEEAIFALQSGEQFGPRQFGGAWWIVRCLDMTPASAIPFARVEQECRESARLEKGIASQAAGVRRDFEDFRRKAPVTVFWDQFYNDFHAPARQISEK